MKLKTTTVVLISIVTMAWLVGCTDVDSNGPTPPEFFSEYRFVNGAEDAGAIGITLDLGPAVSNLDYQGTSSHQTYPSGNRLGVTSSGDSLRIPMTSDQRATIVVLPLSGAGAPREFQKFIERRVFDPPGTSGAWIRVAHAAKAGAVSVTLTGADTTITGVAVTTRSAMTYAAVPSGSYEVAVALGTDTLRTTVQATNTRQTTYVLGDTSSALVLLDVVDN